MKRKSFLEDYENGVKFSGYARILRKKNGYSKILFWRVRFKENNVQLIFQREKIFNLDEIRKIPLGSLIFFEGEKAVSPSGEHSIYVYSIRTELESNKILQNKLSGVNYLSKSDNRILNMIASDSFFNYSLLLSLLLNGVRSFLAKSGFREFMTGILQNYFEGGLAEPFQTQCREKKRPLYLSLTSELKLKRLIIAGFEKVYEISQSFRNEGIDRMHLPEFTLLELYAVNQDYKDMMRLLEEMVSEVLIEVTGKSMLPDGGNTISFMPPFARKTFHEACLEFLGIGGEECTIGWLEKKLPNMFSGDMDEFTWTMKLVDKIFTPNFIEPTFLIDVPSGISPFAKNHPQNPRLSESAFFIAMGVNMATISTGENTVEKVSMLLADQSRRTGRPVNKDYLSALELGLPQTAGIGLGLNRFFMLFQQAEKSARETCLFPVF